MKKNSLDYEVVETPNGKWQIWIPDSTGACIGSGKTLGDAKQDAVFNMFALCSEFLKPLHEIDMQEFTA